jgi:hypothetical protein
MSLSLQIVHDPPGRWTVHGLPSRPVAHLASLSASIDYARKECAEAPATIELMIDGFYAVIHQELGWRRKLLATDDEASRSANSSANSRDPKTSGRWRDWLRRRGHAT